MDPFVDTPQPKQVGLRVASTFRGICEVHDREFAPIDNEPFTASPSQCMLLAFRAISFDIYRKAAHARSMLNAASVVSRDENLIALANLESLEGNLLGSDLGQRDMALLKAEVDRALLERNPAVLEYRVLEFSGAPVIAAAGVFTPDFDLQCNRLQDLGDESSPCETIAVSLLPNKEITYLAFAWRVLDSRPAEFVSSVLECPDDRIASLVPQICLGYLENVYFSRDWWLWQSTIRQTILARLTRFFSSAPLPVADHEFVDWRFNGLV